MPLRKAVINSLNSLPSPQYLTEMFLKARVKYILMKVLERIKIMTRKKSSRKQLREIKEYAIDFYMRSS